MPNARIAIVAVVLCAGCGVTDDTPSGGDTTTVACAQACKDNRTSAGVIDVLNFLYNQTFAGQPVGAQDLTAACALGGSVHITGSNGYDSGTGVITLNLSYDMTSCAASDSAYNLTFGGAVSQSGTLEQQGQISIVYYSAALEFDGTVNGTAVTDSDCSLALQEQRNSDNTNYRVSGNLCDRPVSY